METMIPITPDQRKHIEWIALEIGNAYDKLVNRLVICDWLDLLEELVERYQHAGEFEKYSVIQEFRGRIGA